MVDWVLCWICVLCVWGSWLVCAGAKTALVDSLCEECGDVGWLEGEEKVGFRGCLKGTIMMRVGRISCNKIVVEFLPIHKKNTLLLFGSPLSSPFPIFLHQSLQLQTTSTTSIQFNQTFTVCPKQHPTSTTKSFLHLHFSSYPYTTFSAKPDPHS